METIIEAVDPGRIDDRIIERAGRLIAAGELVAFPTETVYGLGADALNPAASARIYEAKGRPSDNPLIVHIADVKDLLRISPSIPSRAKLLADAFWPGPLTMIVQKSDAVPYATTGGLDTVAVRMPDHPAALALIRRSGCVIAAPSANASGRPSPTEAAHVAEDLSGRIAMILDGGPVGIGIESTIVDLTGPAAMILRPGYITEEMLADVLGEAVLTDPGLAENDESARPKAPGMKYRHYAPQADLTLVEGEQADVAAAINRLTAQSQAEGKKVVVIAAEETGGLYFADTVLSIGNRADEDSIAQHLYGILRECDELMADVIYSESFQTPRIGPAVMNRLLKAAGHKVIRV